MGVIDLNFKLAKGVKVGNLSPEDRQRLFQAIDIKFLLKLVKTGSVPEGCPPNMYKNLAMLILSVVCSEENMVTHQDLLEGLSRFHPLLSLGDITVSEDIEMVQCTYSVLKAIAATEEGREAMLQRHTVKALSEAFTSNQIESTEALHILTYLSANIHARAWKNQDKSLGKVLARLAELVKNGPLEERSEWCISLKRLLIHLDEETVLREETSWMEVVHAGVFQILKSRIGKQQREPALELTAALVELLGVKWILQVKNAKSVPEETNKKNLMILVHLAAVEIRLTIEGHTFTEVQDSGGLLCAMYSILEMVINYLVIESTATLGDKVVLQLHTAMQGAIAAVTFFLHQTYSETPHQLLSPVTIASIRVIAAWIAEETLALKLEIKQVLPIMIEASKLALESGKQNGNEDPMEVDESLPKEAIPSPRSESGLLMLGGEPSHHEPIEKELLRFMLPGLCHISADEEMRESLKRENVNELVQQYFHLVWERYNSKGRGHHIMKQSLETMCSYFMNYAVADEAYVSQTNLFKDLAVFIIHHFPTISSQDGQFVLAYNMGVLGILLYRTYASELVVIEEELASQFLNAVIYLLSRVHVAQLVTKGRFQLAVAPQFKDSWQDVGELWWLGVSVLCQCTLKGPNVANAVLKTGWIPSIIKLLTQIKGNGDKNTIAVYGNLLSTLARTSKACKKVAIEKGGMNLAKLYKMEDWEVALQP